MIENETNKVLDKVLYDASCHMKNGYSRSDNWANFLSFFSFFIILIITKTKTINSVTWMLIQIKSLFINPNTYNKIPLKTNPLAKEIIKEI